MGDDASCGAGTIEVIGAGLGRTGTKSLQAALDRLGYRAYHFPLPAHAETWARYAEGAASSDEVLDMVTREGYNATCDEPAADMYEAQLRKFPHAKVILTVRDSGKAWAASWKGLAAFIEVQERPFSLSYPTFIQWIPFMRAWRRMRDVIGTHLGLPPGMLVRGSLESQIDDAWLASQYQAHNAQVRDRVPAAQLLEFNVKEGWAPLCAFLGKDIPPGPFPNVNESADLILATRVMVGLTYAWIPAVAATVWLVRTGLARLWRRP